MFIPESNAPGGKGLKRKLDNLSVKAQTKWQKFDPNQPVTVTKLQEKLIEEENREKGMLLWYQLQKGLYYCQKTDFCEKVLHWKKF